MRAGPDLLRVRKLRDTARQKAKAVDVGIAARIKLMGNNVKAPPPICEAIDLVLMRDGVVRHDDDLGIDGFGQLVGLVI